MAIPASIVIQAAVQTGFSSNIGCHILVAVQTKLGLRRFIEALVTLLTFILVFDMPSNNLTGHQHFFDILCQNISSHQRSQPKYE